MFKLLRTKVEWKNSVIIKQKLNYFVNSPFQISFQDTLQIIFHTFYFF